MALGGDPSPTGSSSPMGRAVGAAGCAGGQPCPRPSRCCRTRRWARTPHHPAPAHACPAPPPPSAPTPTTPCHSPRMRWAWGGGGGREVAGPPLQVPWGPTVNARPPVPSSWMSLPARPRAGPAGRWDSGWRASTWSSTWRSSWPTASMVHGSCTSTAPSSRYGAGGASSAGAQVFQVPQQAQL